MPDRKELHFSFYRKCHVYELLVDEYKLLHDDLSPSGCYISATSKLCCKSIKVLKVRRFTKWTLGEEIDAALKEALTKHVSNKDLREKKRRHRR